MRSIRIYFMGTSKNSMDLYSALFHVKWGGDVSMKCVGTEGDHCHGFITSSVVLLRPSNAGLGSVERRDRHFTWSSEPREGLTICRCNYKGSTFSSGFLRLWVRNRSASIEPATSRKQCGAQPTEATVQSRMLLTFLSYLTSLWSTVLFPSNYFDVKC